MLLDRSERLHTSGLPFDQLSELGRLYRQHLARLARLRDRDEDPAAVAHLNALCVRAHTFLYVPRATSRPVRRVFVEWLPGALGRTWRVQALAWVLLLLGMLVGGALVGRDRDAVHALIPASMGYPPDQLERLARSPEARAKFLERHETAAGLNFLFGSSLFAHNTRVGLLAFATGVLAGIPTVLLQLWNGVLLGAFATMFLGDAGALDFLAWILPHGIPELTAITLCAAGGLVLGQGVVTPGRQARRQALREAVNLALLLFAGAIPLLALAAVTESFVRESTLGTGARLAVAACYAGALAAALYTVRKFSHREPVDTEWLVALTTPRRSGSSDSGSAAPA